MRLHEEGGAMKDYYIITTTDEGVEWRNGSSWTPLKPGDHLLVAAWFAPYLQILRRNGTATVDVVRATELA